MELFLILTTLGLLALLVSLKIEYDRRIKNLSRDALEQRVKTNLILKELGKEYVAGDGWEMPAFLVDRDKPTYMTTSQVNNMTTACIPTKPKKKKVVKKK